jgi:Protein of unknown function (DUF4238)
MGKRKEHHFVPQFYLRNFSVDEAKRLIAVYNVENNFTFPRAAITHQAKIKYFYGEDDVLEKRLGDIEGEISSVIKYIIENDSLSFDIDEYSKLLRFILYQSARTSAHVESTKIALQELNKNLYQYTGRNFDMDVKDMLSYVDRQLPYLTHAELFLLINETEIPFVTSDNPVVLYNQFMEMKRHPTGASWANKGLQVFLPISPNHMVVLFDPYVYRMGKQDGRGPRQWVVPMDVEYLNSLQYLKCGKLLFYNDKIEPTYIGRLAEKYGNIRLSLSKPEAHTLGSYNLLRVADPRIGISFSFTKLTMGAKKWKPGNMAVYLRHQDFYNLGGP